ncbi:MAG: hypothetical protein ABIP13_00140 [Tepidiformaceae bacterium]
MNIQRVKRFALGAVVIAGLVGSAIVFAGAGGEEHDDGENGESFTVALWGDMPYIKSAVVWTSEQQVANLIADVNKQKVTFSVFDGDIKSGSSYCDDSQYSQAIARFNSLKAPAVYVPGDNEWTDCHRKNNAAAAPGYNALERLTYIRQTMFNTVFSFGQKTMKLEHQGLPGQPYSENTRWTRGGVIFVGLNVPGSNNNLIHASECLGSKSYRTQADCDADNAEYAARDAKNLQWIKESFELARSKKAPGIMFVLQADMGFDLPETETVNEGAFATSAADIAARAKAGYDGFDKTVTELRNQSLNFSGQVVLVHGDTHSFKVDKPLITPDSPAAGPFHVVTNFTRVETFGESNADWVRLTVNLKSRNVFNFEPMIVAANH